MHPTVADAVARAGEALEAAGYAVEEAAPPDWNAAAEDWDAFIHAEAMVFTRPVFEKHGDPASLSVFKHMAERPMPATEDYMRLLARRATRQRAWALWTAERPLLVVPSSNEPPLPQGLDETDFPRVFRAQSPLFPTVLLGVPSVAVPTGVVDGLPTGVQVVAPRWREDLALDAAEAIEAAWPMPTPVEPKTS